VKGAFLWKTPPFAVIPASLLRPVFPQRLLGWMVGMMPVPIEALSAGTAGTYAIDPVEHMSALGIDVTAPLFLGYMRHSGKTLPCLIWHYSLLVKKTM
jgi:hypothetical protein